MPILYCLEMLELHSPENKSFQVKVAWYYFNDRGEGPQMTMVFLESPDNPQASHVVLKRRGSMYLIKWYDKKHLASLARAIGDA